jgi:hypothetical protein
LINCCERVGRVIDDALRSASKAGIETSTEADVKFKRVIKVLSDYEKKYHSNETVGAGRMATESAMESLMILNTLKEKVRAREVFEWALLRQRLVLIEY